MRLDQHEIIAKPISQLTPEELELARKAAFVDFTGLMEKRIRLDNPFRKVLRLMARQLEDPSGANRSVFRLFLTQKHARRAPPHGDARLWRRAGRPHCVAERAHGVVGRHDPDGSARYL